MTGFSSLKRRDFLRRSTAAMAAGVFSVKKLLATGYTIEEAAAKVGRLPRLKFGPGGQEVSIIFGAGDMPSPVADAAILCGVNYWHKANHWTRSVVPPAILKNREAHFCQVTVDRIGGNHEVGRLDEESHYDFVKDILNRTKLGYFDDMQLHYGYHNAAEVRSNRAFVRAFERLEKEGLVRHLCLSQHSYAGNARVPRGESAVEVLTAVIEDGLHEHAQIIYSYGQDPETEAFLSFAGKKGFGTTAMKTARGVGRMKQDESFVAALPEGTAPHNALVRWLTTVSEIDTVVIRVRNLNELVETYSGAGKRLTAGDARALEMMTVRADRTACRLCTTCQPHCPRNVPITEILRFERYALDDQDWGKARALYAGLDRKADACSYCRACQSHCPQNLAIPEKLAAVHSVLYKS
jgi:predicted aldo/keto reductase-like oxidoreductase